MRRVCLLLCALLPAATDAAADTGFLDRTVSVAGVTYRYEVYVPAEHAPTQTWPIVVDLHGNGAQGSDGIRQTAHFFADQIRMQRSRFPMIVVFPQAALGQTWQGATMQDMVAAELDATIREFHGDPDRVCLTGFSMGGAGVYALAARWPEKFAGLIAIAGGGGGDVDALAHTLAHIPIWIVHGDADERVPVTASREMVDALKKINARVTYTEYAGGRHGPTAEKIYADPEFTSWLLAQRRPAH
jgi:predicted peptidase